LKPSPDSLKYVFLGPNEYFLMIVAFDLNENQEVKSLTILRENKEAIGWTLGNTKGISYSIV